MELKSKTKLNRVIAKLSIGFASFVLVGVSLFSAPLQAFAQVEGLVKMGADVGTAASDAAVTSLPVSKTADIPAAKANIKDSIQKFQKSIFVQALVTMLINLLSFAANRLAYDTATMIVNGGPADDPLYDGTPAEKFFRSYGEAVAGESLGLFNEALNDAVAQESALLQANQKQQTNVANQAEMEDFLNSVADPNSNYDANKSQDQIRKEYGGVYKGVINGAQAGLNAGLVLKKFNVCAPNSKVGAVISIGIKETVTSVTPKCDFKQVVTNWDGFIASFKIDQNLTAADKTKRVLDNLGLSFRPGNNDLSLSVNLMSQTLSDMVQKSQAKLAENIMNSGFKNVTNVITGQVQTPADILKEKTKKDLADAQSATIDTNRQLLANTDALQAVGVQVVSTFSNTLLSGLTQKLFSGIFKTDPNKDPFANIDAISISGRDNALNDFRFLLTATPLQISNYSLINDFITCPTQSRGIYNCVLDSNFATVLARAEAGKPMTLQEAVDQKLIKKEWKLIPPDDLMRNQDPYCHTYAFCETNLVKLRKARVIPVGWELAAQSPANKKEGVNMPVSLGDVMGKFNDCNSSGQLDAIHPFCKLIDPNWVLKYPDTQCRMQVNGQVLEVAGADTRKQECADVPSCVKENDDGTCAGYGYCTQEQNTWRFRGEACEEQNASCTTFTTTDNKKVSYLKNTVDQAGCNEGNAGCLQYMTERVFLADGAWHWNIGSGRTISGDADAYAKRISFTSAVAKCDESGGGCSELLRRTDSVRLNLLRNSSFESDDNRDGVPDGWTVGGAAWDATGASAFVGKGGLKAGGSATQSGLVLGQRRYYTLSYYGRGTDTSVAISLKAGAAPVDMRGISMTGNCSLAPNGDIVVKPAVAETQFARATCTFASPALTSASAVPLATVVVTATNGQIDAIQLEQAANVSAYHDGYSTGDIQKVVAKVAPKYLGCTGAATDSAECKKYAKVCSENDVGCRRYIPENGDPTVTGVATAQDVCPAMCVGYDAYKEEATTYEAARFPVAFIPSTAKKCTEKEVGCAEFTNLKTEAKEYYTNLRSCVLETVGGTGTAVNPDVRAYYTWEGSDEAGYQLRTWKLLKSNSIRSSYTHAVSGFVDAAPEQAPCANFVTTDAGIVCAEGNTTAGTEVWDTPSCDEHSDIFSSTGDCRELYDERGNIHYRLWSKTVTANDSCVAYRKTEITGAASDAATAAQSCAISHGFYDQGTGTCRFFGYDKESEGCSAGSAGCRMYTGGRSRNSQKRLEETFEGGSVSNWDAPAGSRLVYSNESLASAGHSLLATSSFRSYVADNGQACTDANGCAGTPGNFGGNCTIKGPTKDSTGADVPGDRYCGTLEGKLKANKTYSLSFFAKGTGTVTARFDLAATGAPEINAAFGSASINPADTTGVAQTLTGEWKRYDLGPLDVNSANHPNFGSGTALSFVLSSGAQMYIDNIVLREGEDKITVVRNSWTTPASCDTDPTGANSPGYYLGCRAYTEEGKGTVDLKSFSRLCGEDKIGCDAYYQTHESTDPYASVFGARCTIDGNPATAAIDPVTVAKPCNYVLNDPTSPYLCTVAPGDTTCQFDLKASVPKETLPSHLSFDQSTHISPADEDAFLIVTPATTCDAGVAGCTEYGLPTYTQDNANIVPDTIGVNGATTKLNTKSVYLINDPDRYSEILCSASELFCAEFTALDSSKSYFKNPQSKTCDYRTGVIVNNVARDGWFKTGTTDYCYDNALEGGVKSLIWKNGDTANYQGWVGTCSEKANLCTEFQDTLDLNDGVTYDGIKAKSYYYLNNESLKNQNIPGEQQCNGFASLKDGCVLFRDPAKAALTSNSSATDVLSKHADTLSATNQAAFSLVSPVDCSKDASQTTYRGVDLCAQRCMYPQVTTTGVGLAQPVFGGSCVTSDDCAPRVSQTTGKTDRGVCAKTGSIATAFAPSNTVVPRLINDTNTVLKVTRDRQCSEWLACSSEQRVWDARAGAYRSVCDQVGLCNQFSNSAAAGFCSSWIDEPAVRLTAEHYSARDVSWYGTEFAGYSIPNLFPAQKLSQVQVGVGTCDWNQFKDVDAGNYRINAKFQGEACNIDLDCVVPNGTEHKGVCRTDKADPYRLAYQAGACTTKNGSACNAGVCTVSGSACSQSGDCGADGGTCEVGQCVQVQVQAQQPVACKVTADCAATFACEQDVCTKVINPSITAEAYTANPTGVCGAGTSTSSPRFRQTTLNIGTCTDNRCLLSPEGTSFAANTVEGKTCRAYPEATSPYPASIVTKWVDSVSGAVIPEGTPPNSDAIPYTYRDGYDQVATCQPGEDCTCSYTRRKFGVGGAVARYYGVGSAALRDSSQRGICGAGTVGAACGTDKDCTPKNGKSQTGSCVFPQHQDDVYGIDGYCLERDGGVNINGDAHLGACLTWLPIDRTLGSSDLNAKSLEAGLISSELNYCSRVDAFVQPKTARGCSLRTDSDGTKTAMESCLQIAAHGNSPAVDSDTRGFACPPGQYAVLGNYAESGDSGVGIWKKTLKDLKSSGSIPSGESVQAEICQDDSHGDTQNNCPFMCVPYGATATDQSTGQQISCDPDSVGLGNFVYTTIVRNKYVRKVTGNFKMYDIPVYWIEDPISYQNFYNKLKACVGPAVRIEQNYGTTTADEGLVLHAGHNDVNDLTALRSFFGALVGIPPGTTGHVIVDASVYLGGQVMPDNFRAPCDAGLYHNLCGWTKLTYEGGAPNAPFLGCSEVATAQNERLDGAIYTDKLYQQNSKISSLTALPAGSGSYDYQSGENFFGRALSGVELAKKAVSQPSILNGLCYWSPPVGPDSLVKKLRIYVQPKRTSSGWACPTAKDSTNPPEVQGMPATEEPGFTDPEARPYVNVTGSTVYYGKNKEAYDVPIGQKDTFKAVLGYAFMPNDSAQPEKFISGSSPEGALQQFVARAVDYKIFEDGVWARDAIPSGVTDTSFAGKIRYGLHAITDFATAKRAQYSTADQETRSVVRDDYSVLSAPDPATVTGAAHTIDDWDSRIKDVKPPKVYAVDTSKCDGSICNEGPEGKFTIGDKYTGNILANGYFAASLKFYMSADKNHLPLRRVIIEWGDKKDQADQAGSALDDNYFKNHRGYMPNSTKSWCDMQTEWGMTSQSCDPNYISYTKVYTCSVNPNLDKCDDADNNGVPDSSNQGKYFGQGKGCKILGTPTTPLTCYFKPRIHVRDNWGFCSGVCTAASPGVAGSGNACFDPGTNSSLAKENGGISECFVKDEGSPLTAQSDPWVYYDGLIQVSSKR